jgi:hypothetical protein
MLERTIPAGAAAPVLQRAWRFVAVPVLAFALAQAVLMVAAQRAGERPFKPSTWCRGDSGHYFAIAIIGYTFHPCDVKKPDGGGWCGTAGWLPAYPLLLRGARRLGYGIRPAAVVVALAFGVAALAMFVRLLLGAGRAPFLVVLAAALFPSAVYQHGAFPLSMFALFTIACLAALAGRRWRLAGVAGALAAFTYSTGWFLAAVAFAWCLLGGAGGDRRQRLRTAAATAGAILLGFAAVLVWHRLTVGAWDAFFRVQSGNAGLANPAATWLRRVAGVFDPAPEIVVPAAQTLVVTLWLATIAACAFRQRARLSAAERVVLLYTGVFWLAPLALGAGIALHRAESLLFPSLVLYQRLPRPALVLFALAGAALFYATGRLFLGSALL